VLGRGKTGKLIAFDTTTGAEAQSWEFAGQWHENSPDGTLVASVDIDRALEPNKKERHKTLHIWDAASSKKLFSFALSPLVGTDSFGLFFNRDGKRLTFISKLDDEADELFIFDPVAGKRLGKVMRPAPTVHSERADRRLPPVFSRDGSQLVIPSGNGMTIWDVATGKLLRNLRGHVSDVEAWCLLPDGQRMLSVELGGTLKDWDLTETKPTYLPVTGDLARFSISAKIAVSADGSVVAFFDRKLREDDPESPPSVSVWDVATGKAKALVPDPRPESVKSARDILTCQLAVSDNNCRVALARKWMQASGIEKNFFERDSDKDHAAVSVFDLASGKPIWQQFFPESSSAGNAVLALAPDGARVAVALKKPRKDEYDIKVIDVDTARERVIPVVHGSLNSMRFSPDGRRLATLVADTAIKAKRVSSQLTVWDLATLKPVFTVTTPMGGGPIAWSRDGACLALVPFMYDAATGKGLGNLEALDQGLGTVNDLVFSPDGLRIAGTIEAPRLVKSGPLVKVWDAATGKELLLLQPTRRVEASGRDACCVAFSADGHRLLHFDYWQRQKENAVVVTTWDATPRELVEPRTQRGHGP
jgi:WD40 repeat protein